MVADAAFFPSFFGIHLGHDLFHGLLTRLESIHYSDKHLGFNLVCHSENSINCYREDPCIWVFFYDFEHEIVVLFDDVTSLSEVILPIY
jgi:hypothetical protein